MKTVFKIFFGAEETRPFLVLLCLLLAGAAEIGGMGTLLPLATSIAGGTTEKSSPLNLVIMDFLNASGITPSLGNLITIVSVLLALKAVLSFAALSYAGISAAKVAVNIRRRLIAALFDARWVFYTNQNSGKFANALGVDATRSGEAYMLAAQAISRLTQVVVYVLVSFVIDWRLASLAFGAGVLLTLSFSRLVRAARRAGSAQNKQTQILTVLTVDIIANIKPLKSMARYQYLLAKLGTTLKQMRRALVVRELSMNGLAQASDLLIAVLVGVGVFTANHLWHTPLPELVVSGVIFYQIVASTSKLQRFLQQAVALENSYMRVTRLISQAEQEREGRGGKAVPDIGQGCRFEDVRFSHGGQAIIKGISLEIPANSITVLQGPSGAGKTTLIDLLTGLHVPQSGQILIGGVPSTEIDVAAWRRQIGYVPQELNLLHTTIRENITLGDPAVSDETVLATLARVGALDFLQASQRGLDTNVGEMGGKLSGGQRQRISLARALATGPRLLILDEVTSALDPETEAAIVDNILNLKRDHTIVAITHRPAWTRIADRVYNVEDGMVTSGTAEEPSRKERKAPARRRAGKRK